MIPLTPELMVDGVVLYVLFVFSTTLHEAAHAWAAMRLGDPTAYYGGQVTLNPMPHIEREPVGMVIVPVIVFLTSGGLMGWASAPYNPQWALNYPKRAALMALAGPVANFLQVLVAALLIKILLQWHGFDPNEIWRLYEIHASSETLAGGLAKLLLMYFQLNLLLGIFNLIPLPPLDGSAVITLFMSPSTARKYFYFTWGRPEVRLAGIVVAWWAAKHILPPVGRFVIDLLF